MIPISQLRETNVDKFSQPDCKLIYINDSAASLEIKYSILIKYKVTEIVLPNQDWLEMNKN